jgi:hypothetical protein
VLGLSLFLRLFLAYFPYFEKIKVGLWDHHTVCLRILSTNFRKPEPFFMKLVMYIMKPESISTAYFIHPSRQSVCLYVNPPTVARQLLGKNVTAATNTHATVEELSEESFSLRSTCDEFFPELLLSFTLSISCSHLCFFSSSSLSCSIFCLSSSAV